MGVQARSVSVRKEVVTKRPRGTGAPGVCPESVRSAVSAHKLQPTELNAAAMAWGAPKESSQKMGSGMTLELQLVKELEGLRDKLIQLSLVMHDLKFLVDAPQRAEAQELTADCIMRIQSRQQGLE